MLKVLGVVVQTNKYFLSLYSLGHSRKLSLPRAEKAPVCGMEALILRLGTGWSWGGNQFTQKRTEKNQEKQMEPAAKFP